jgi:hypothetical protein
VTLQNALSSLWGTCIRTSTNAILEEKNQNVEVVTNLFEKKNKLDNKYTSLLEDVKK